MSNNAQQIVGALVAVICGSAAAYFFGYGNYLLALVAAVACAGGVYLAAMGNKPRQ